MNIVQFAKRVGLSTATVSRAFHEPNKVKPATLAQVLTLAKELNYYPDASGRALVTGKHDVIGLIWPLEVEGSAAPFAQQVLAAMTRYLVQLDLDLLICPVDRREASTLAHAKRTIQRSRCDAWILLYPRPGDLLFNALSECRKPIVSLMGQILKETSWKSVALDQAAWMRDALQRLRKAGGKRVLLVGGREGEPDHEERVEAFHNLSRKIFAAPKTRPVHFHCREQGSALAQVIAEQSIDSIIGIDGTATASALHACAQLDLKVPSQVRVTGIDELPMESAAVFPKLSHYRQPFNAMAACAIELALGKRSRSRRFTATYVGGDSA